MKNILVAATLVVAATVAPVPAHAADTQIMSDGWARWVATDRTTGELMNRGLIQLEAPRYAWGMRLVARNINRRTDLVHVYRHGTCEQRPRALCIKVRVRNYGPTPWVGLFLGDEIRLNRYYARNTYPRRHVACHELGHALGVMHHSERGCLGTNRPDGGEYLNPSRTEMKSLRAAYREVLP